MRVFVQGQGNQGIARRRTLGTPHKRSRRLTPRLGKKTIYGWKPTKPFVLMKPPGMIKLIMFIFFCEKENEPKEIARATRPFGLPGASQIGRSLWNSLAFSHSAYPPASAMLGASQRGRSTPLRWSATLRGFSEASRYSGGESRLIFPSLVAGWIFPFRFIDSRAMATIVIG